MLKKLQKALGLNKSSLLLIIVGSFVLCLTMVRSGLCFDASCTSGIGFWGPNGHDGIWHVALAESLKRGSLTMPVFAGQQIKNYHVGFDLLLAGISKITFVPVLNLYFQVMPIILALGIGFAVYYFVLHWQRSNSKAFWATFFTYFGGSFGFLVTFFRNGQVGGESMFWSQQSVSSLINPPFALSIILLFVGLLLALRLQRKFSLAIFIIAALIFGSLIEIKAYAGLLALFGLLASGLFEIVIHRKWNLIKLFFGSLVISLVIFLPLNKNSNSLLIFQPFWFLETMMAVSDRFYWPQMASAMVNYKAGGIWAKAIAAYTVAFIVFVAGNFGTRFIGKFYYLKKITRLKEIDFVDIFFLSVILAGIALPTLFLQKGTPWNTIQFLYYSLIFSGVLAGVAFSGILDKFGRKAQIIAISFLFLFTLPTTLGSLAHYIPKLPAAIIPKDELDALIFLSREPDGVVLTYPFDQIKADAAPKDTPRPLYLYVSTAYVSAFAKKPVFLEDEVNLDITNFDWKGRRSEVESFLASQKIENVRSFLKNNNISYIYWLKGQRAVLGETQLGIEKIYENGEVDIYRVIR